MLIESPAHQGSDSLSINVKKNKNEILSGSTFQSFLSFMKGRTFSKKVRTQRRKDIKEGRKHEKIGGNDTKEEGGGT